MWGIIPVQATPSGLGPEMELFRMAFKRHYSEITNESKREHSKSINRGLPGPGRIILGRTCGKVNLSLKRPSGKTRVRTSLAGRTIVLQGRTIVLKTILPGRTIILPVMLFHKHPKFLRGRTLLRPSRKARVYGTASRKLTRAHITNTS